MNIWNRLSRREQPDSLGLSGDGDDIDLIEAIERSFGLQLKNEPADWYTVGDIYQHLLGTIEASDNNQQKCSGQMAFYSVRRALNKLAPNIKITPKTNFSELGLRNHKPLQTLLANEGGLVAPSAAVSGPGCLGVILMWVAAAIWLHNSDRSAGLMILFIIAGVAAIPLFPVKFEGTIGEFSLAVAELNYAYFVAKGARSNPQRLWEALGHVIHHETDFNRHHLNRDTLLLLQGKTGANATVAN